ncbi:TetR/AcrR family transcriptional regulator [Marinactinospora rubrisoli]|uniref:TetR/AcrR family transcriptional regulator n=1 Tax=Marinactinospora rubrisoli TaxID=2715399 RepID=A0ABW2K873_9ACTN
MTDSTHRQPHGQQPPKRERTRKRILDAAEEAIRENSNLHALDMEEVAARAGIARSGLYRYFPTKEDMLKTLITQRSAELRFGAQPLADNEDLARYLQRSLSMLVQFWRDRRAIYLTGLDLSDIDRDFNRQWNQELVDNWTSALVGVYEREVAAGRVTAPLADPWSTAEFLTMAVVSRLQSLYRETDRPEREELVLQAMLEVVFRSFGLRPPVPAA